MVQFFPSTADPDHVFRVWCAAAGVKQRHHHRLVCLGARNAEEQQQRFVQTQELLTSTRTQTAQKRCKAF